jgi:hypothetical protein
MGKSDGGKAREREIACRKQMRPAPSKKVIDL